MPQSHPDSASAQACASAQRLVFVYGTLRKGCANDITRLSPPPVFVAQASVPGVLYRLGWYPGLRLGESSAGRVVGEIYAIGPALETRLDEIEEVYPQGSQEYTRRMVAVQAQGRAWDCLVYEANAGVCEGMPLIASGDWVQHVQEQGLGDGLGQWLAQGRPPGG